MGRSKEAYLECMTAYLEKKTEYGWYLRMHGDQIIGGLGVVENDFHDRKDLSPNVCAVYTEEAHRGQGIAGKLLNFIEGIWNMSDTLERNDTCVGLTITGENTFSFVTFSCIRYEMSVSDGNVILISTQITK